LFATYHARRVFVTPASVRKIRNKGKNSACVYELQREILESVRTLGEKVR